MPEILVVHNTRSGASDSLDAIKKAFADQEVTPRYLVLNPTTLARQLKEASKQPSVIIVAAGGDGTINSVAEHLSPTTPLGILPTGTLNHFAKALNIPLDLPAAVQTILEKHHQQVDIGTVNDHIFLNNASIGFYPRSLRIRETYDQQIGKWPAAFIGLAHVILFPRHYLVEITLKGTRQTMRTPFVFIGNNEYQRTPPDTGERAHLDSGQLAIYILKATSHFGILRSLVHIFFTKKRRTQDFVMHTTDTVTIRTKKQTFLAVACDGERYRMQSPLYFKSAHKQLRVIVPLKSKGA